MQRRSFIDWLVTRVTARPVSVVVGVGLLTGLAVLTLRHLKLEGSVYDLFPDRPGPVADLGRYTRAFGEQEGVVVLVTGPDGDSVERATRQVAAQLSRSPLIRQVRSGLDARTAARFLGPSLLLLAGSESWPEVRDRLTSGLERQVRRLRQVLLSPLTPDRELLERDPLLISEVILKGMAAGVSERSGLYASPDGKAALIFAAPKGPSSDLDFCRRLKGSLDRLNAGVGVPGVRLQFTGGHLYTTYVAEALQRDLTVSSILAVVGVALVQLLFFRSLRLIPLSALVAGVALSWTLAIAVVTVGHLNALSLAFAAMFIGMSDDVLIHIVARTRGLMNLPPATRLSRAVSEVAPALLAATLTTITAFLSFGLSTFAGLSHLGLLAACGLLMNLVLAVIFFPAVGVLFPPGPGPGGTTRMDRALGQLGALAERRPRLVLAVALLAGVVTLFATGGLRFSEDLSRLAPTDMPPSRADQEIARRFERSPDRVIVLLEGKSTEDVLRANDRLAERLEELLRRGEVASYLSLSRLLPSLATQESRLARLRALDLATVSSRLAAALDRAGLRPEAFRPFLDQLVAPRRLVPGGLPADLSPLVSRQLTRAGDRTIVATILYGSARARAQDLAAAVRLTAPGIEVRVTGAGLAGAQMARLLRRDLFTVSLTTLAAVVLVLGLLVRRLWPVVATVLSLCLAGVLFGGCLRLLGLEIDVYNLMVIPIIIGYGVDDHLYLMHRILHPGSPELIPPSLGPSAEGDVQASVVESGRPVLAATLTTIAAFAALGACGLPGLRTLGLTGALGLGLGLIASLVIMPALLALAPSRRRPC